MSLRFGEEGKSEWKKCGNLKNGGKERFANEEGGEKTAGEWLENKRQSWRAT